MWVEGDKIHYQDPDGTTHERRIPDRDTLIFVEKMVDTEVKKAEAYGRGQGRKAMKDALLTRMKAVTQGIKSL